MHRVTFPVLYASYFMKKFLFVILSLCCQITAYGAKIEDRYIMRPFEDGQLYFIVPFEIPAESAKTKEIAVDITYLTQSDSVTMNISVWNAKELMTDSIVFIGQKRITVRDFQTFFIEQDNKLWLHRYSLKIPLSDLAILYSGTTPYKICFYNNAVCLKFGYSDKQWEKERNWMNQIIHTITTNKRLYK